MIKRDIVLISSPRSGSTYITRLLSESNHVTNLEEPFHPTQEANPITYHLLHRTPEIGTMHEGLTPVEQINICKNTIPSKYFVYKIFPGHIKEQRYINEIINQSFVVIILYRNILKKFISDRKARKIDAWENVNTTDIKIHFDIDDYKFYKQKNEKFIEFNKKYVQSIGKPFYTIQYESFFSMTIQEQVEYLNNIRELSELKIPSNIEMPMKRQDNNPEVKSSIENIKLVENFINQEYNTNYVC